MSGANGEPPPGLRTSGGSMETSSTLSGDWHPRPCRPLSPGFSRRGHQRSTPQGSGSPAARSPVRGRAPCSPPPHPTLRPRSESRELSRPLPSPPPVPACSPARRSSEARSPTCSPSTGVGPRLPSSLNSPFGPAASCANLGVGAPRAPRPSLSCSQRRSESPACAPTRTPSASGASISVASGAGSLPPPRPDSAEDPESDLAASFVPHSPPAPARRWPCCPKPSAGSPEDPADTAPVHPWGAVAAEWAGAPLTLQLPHWGQLSVGAGRVAASCSASCCGGLLAPLAGLMAPPEGYRTLGGDEIVVEHEATTPAVPGRVRHAAAALALSAASWLTAAWSDPGVQAAAAVLLCLGTVATLAAALPSARAVTFLAPRRPPLRAPLALRRGPRCRCVAPRGWLPTCCAVEAALRDGRQQQQGEGDAAPPPSSPPDGVGSELLEAELGGLLRRLDGETLLAELELPPPPRLRLFGAPRWGALAVTSRRVLLAEGGGGGRGGCCRGGARLRTAALAGHPPLAVRRLPGLRRSGAAALAAIAFLSLAAAAAAADGRWGGNPAGPLVAAVAALALLAWGRWREQHWAARVCGTWVRVGDPGRALPLLWALRGVSPQHPCGEVPPDEGCALLHSARLPRDGQALSPLGDCPGESEVTVTEDRVLVLRRGRGWPRRSPSWGELPRASIAGVRAEEAVGGLGGGSWQLAAAAGLLFPFGAAAAALAVVHSAGWAVPAAVLCICAAVAAAALWRRSEPEANPWDVTLLTDDPSRGRVWPLRFRVPAEADLGRLETALTAEVSWPAQARSPSPRRTGGGGRAPFGETPSDHAPYGVRSASAARGPSTPAAGASPEGLRQRANRGSSLRRGSP
eukprot:TRINITY_DN2966_c0_g3_i4.p1 TRINITY_DN2966_c0_g3~~TRINITY_DN2966_c0_g3_i4.p1  ORF type:complete len:860 (+),score=179.80 TRINITY_DN2966_c0_g3_i4:89-2668(+)